MNRTLLVVGPRQLSDLLFWQQVGRALTGQGPDRPLLIVHSCGEFVEQLLEGDGMEMKRPLNPDSPARSALLARGLREESRRIVNRLAEDGVSALGVLGSDRGLLRLQSDSLVVSNIEWVSRLVDAGSVVLVGSALEANESWLEWPSERVAMVLAEAMGSSEVVLIGQNGCAGDEFTLQEARASVDHPDELNALLQAGLSVRISAISGLNNLNRIPGKRVSADPPNRPKTM